MDSRSKLFEKIPDFDETIRRILKVPFPDAEPPIIPHSIRDELNDITYQILSRKRLSPSEIQGILINSFNTKEMKAAKSGEKKVIDCSSL